MKFVFVPRLGERRVKAKDGCGCVVVGPVVGSVGVLGQGWL